MATEITIKSRDYWVKVVAMLQQNWALVAEDPASGEVVAYFINDHSGIFDQLNFIDVGQAPRALERNGFRNFGRSPDLQDFLRPPAPPFAEGTHSSGKIYSSGGYWV